MKNFRKLIIFIIILNTIYLINIDIAFSQNSNIKKIIRLKAYPNIADSTFDWDETIIYFEEGATPEWDGKYDALKSQNYAPNLPNLYSITPNGYFLAGNGLPPLNGNLIVPLGFNSLTSGTYFIKVEEIQNFSKSEKIFLIDSALNKSLLLGKDSVYKFNYITNYGTNIPDRKFYLLFKTDEVGLNNTSSNYDNGENKINISPNPFKDEMGINYILPEKSEVSIDIYNIIGEKVYYIDKTIEYEGVHKEIIKSLSLGNNPGVYFLKIRINNSELKRKIILIN